MFLLCFENSRNIFKKNVKLSQFLICSTQYEIISKKAIVGRKPWMSTIWYQAKGVYYSVAVRRIRLYIGYGIRLLQKNQCGLRLLYCYTVAENWNLNERFTVGFGFLLHLHEIAILKRICIVLKMTCGCGL